MVVFRGYTQALGGAGTFPKARLKGTCQTLVDSLLAILQEEIVMRIPVIILLLLACSSNVFADCVRNARGRTVCGNGEEAGGYNARTGTAWKSEKNDAGVRTTETRRGGEAKTKNGKGVYKSSGGTTCVRTARNQGCR